MRFGRRSSRTRSRPVHEVTETAVVPQPARASDVGRRLQRWNLAVSRFQMAEDLAVQDGEPRVVHRSPCVPCRGHALQCGRVRQ